MTGLELTERLIADIKKSIEIRGNVPDVYTQIKLTVVGHNDLKEFVSALNVDKFDLHLKHIVQLVNWGSEILISHKHGDEINIVQFYNDVIKNQEKISRQIQYFLDNESIIFTGNNKPTSDFLLKELDELHRSAN